MAVYNELHSCNLKLFKLINYYIDIDRCASNPCHPNAICTNINGTMPYDCECDTGYEGDGINCQGMPFCIYSVPVAIY